MKLKLQNDFPRKFLDYLTVTGSFFFLASLGLSDPMDWFHSYYKQAEHSVQSLVQIR